MHLHMSPHVRWRRFDDGIRWGRRLQQTRKNAKYQFGQLWHCYSTREHTVRTHAPKCNLNHIEPMRIASGVKFWRKKTHSARAHGTAHVSDAGNVETEKHRGFVVREGQAGPAPCVLAASGTLHQARSATGHFAGLITMHYPGKYAHVTQDCFLMPKMN